MSAPPQPTSTAMAFLDLATLVTLTAALVYTAGWSYAWRYFLHFQIGLLALEVPAESYFIYGFWVFRDWWWLGLVALFVVLLVVWSSPLLARHARWGRVVGLPLVLGLFVFVSWMGVVTGSQHFQAQRDNDFPAMPRLRVWLKPPPGEDPGMEKLATALPQGCHRLLLHNRSTLFVFRSRPGASPAFLAVVALPMAEVRALRVLPQFRSCEEE